MKFHLQFLCMYAKEIFITIISILLNMPKTITYKHFKIICMPLKILPHPQGALKKIHFKIISCFQFFPIKWLSDVRYSSLSCSLTTWQHHHLGNYSLMPCSPKSYLHATCSLALWMTSTTAETEGEDVIKKHRCSLRSYRVNATE